ncbi:hypothetical protein NKR23_g1519 [Pleurostoma richardsiae]|uniref:Uncharacterized protein n=1 Tax=Pleurostoma richardsiae TaxID=41990 RepID=A0AA38RZN2_9PEZI|nr:hypothetical protein NKR23_g1519 [Pleurostoma richardsiae]
MSLADPAPLQSSSSSLPQQQNASIPRLAEPFQPTPSPKSDTTPKAEAGGDGNTSGEHGEAGKKHKKRGLFGFGKKKDKDNDSRSKSPSKAVPSSTDPAPASTHTSQDAPPTTRRAPTSPILTESSTAGRMPSSPGRALSSSPRLSSPAGSQIFERDVQESAAQLVPNSPAIPSHITTENHIPPVLDASSEVVTDDHLNPDAVEIITHSGHQPAALTVTGSFIPDQTASPPASWADELASSFAGVGGGTADASSGRAVVDDSASNYGSFDQSSTDVRRLSFISFADVVQAEQQQGGLGVGAGVPGGSSRDSMHLAGLTSLASAGMINRSPSPIRSPVSSSGGGAPGTSSPPTSKSGSVKGFDVGGGGASSPGRKPLGSPGSMTHGVVGGGGGELNIETMSQALRRTGSADLSGVRSLPVSPIEGPSR